MTRHSFFSFALAFVFFITLGGHSSAQDDKSRAEIVVHLLSYVAKDYVEAVENGQVIDQGEYEEQQEFSGQAYTITKESSFLKGAPKEELLLDLQQLVKIIDEKREVSEISSLAKGINAKIFRLTGIETAPKKWPSLQNGARLYAQNCATCHGDSGGGDGPAGVGLEPRPTNFLDPELMDHSSAYQSYNVVQFGVEGTGMRAFTEFSESELWDLAFYVKSLRYQNQSIDSADLKHAFSKIFPQVGLEEVAQMTDSELLDTIQHLSAGNAALKLRSLRLLAPSKDYVENSLPIAIDHLQKALKWYSEGDTQKAQTWAVSAYLEGIEPVESRLRSIDNGFVSKLEAQMFQVRTQIEKGENVAAVEKEIEKSIALIKEADELLNAQQLNFWLTFLLAFSLVLREALEAFLILAVVITLIRSADAKKALVWVHGGWITAVLCGIAGWFLSDYIIQFGGKNREILEGLVSLLAVGILVFAGFWLHNKTYAKKWSEFVEDKIGVYLKRERMLGLAAFSFMIVFREAFEVVLFLQAINLEAGPQHKSAIGIGALAAFGLLIVIAYVFLKYTRNLPIPLIFKYSSYLIIFLAIILIGKGVHSLQESGWISVTHFDFMPRISWLGIFPTLQTMGAQVGLFAVIVLTYYVNKRKMERL